jgi:expansin (peptidoglycan-binding protein)
MGRTSISVVGCSFAIALSSFGVACSGSDAHERSPSTGGATNSAGGAANGAGGHATSGAGGTKSSGGSGPASGGATGGGDPYGQVYSGGQFHLGPVDYDQTQWPNACAPGTKYAADIRAVEGNLLAGLWNGIPNVASYCDACISVKTDKGKTAILRVVTYGDTTTNSIDVSPEAYAILNSGEYPRSMQWQFVKCPDTGKVMYEFQTGSSEWWTSLWVRNARVPLTKVEVKSPNHTSFVELARGSDGTLTDGKGFGKGSFTIQLTGMDGQTYSDTFDWPAAGIAGQTLTGQSNID